MKRTSYFRIACLTALCALIALSVMSAGTYAAKGNAGASGSTPKVTLSAADPFDYTTIEGKKKALSKAETYPESFDLRYIDTDNDGTPDLSCVTPVKLQNPFGSCWGFAAIGAAESSLLGSGLAEQKGYDASTLNLSEKHLAYFASNYLDDPGDPQNTEGTHHAANVSASDIMNIGGTPILATNVFASGVGPVYETRESDPSDETLVYKGKNGNIDSRMFDIDDPPKIKPFSYSAEDDWSIDKDYRFRQSFVLKQSYMLPDPADIDEDANTYTYNPAATAAIKDQLQKRRGVEVAFMADTSSPNQSLEEDGMFLSTKNWAHYTWTPTGANHAVEIIGWDDNYPRENFVEEHQPPQDMFPDGKHEGAANGGNGAWLVKNSWGSGEVDFPNKGEGNWGLYQGQDKAPYEKRSDIHTGYFWISYYDQSLCQPEALEFDDANTADGYHLDQHDYMQVHFLLASKEDQTAKASNVFTADIAQTLEQVSCQTSYPGTEVTYEVYLLPASFSDPEEGLKVAEMHETYEYGGFHKVALPEPILIQKGQKYAVVVTQKTPDGKYAINTPIGFATGSDQWDVGIINEEESFVFTDDSWKDYSDEDVRKETFDNPGIEKPAFDNFSIKGFCKKTNNDVAIRVSGRSTSMRIFRGETYSFRVNFTGSSAAALPDDPEITWAFANGDDDIATMVISGYGSKAVITPKKEGNSYFTVTVKGIGTTVIPFTINKCSPSVTKFRNADEEGRPLPYAYTGKEIIPDFYVCLDEPSLPVLEPEKEYTYTLTDNIKCGAAMITVRGAGELYDEQQLFQERFPIAPAKAEILSVTGAPAGLTIKVKDQKASGVTGYQVNYRIAGQSKWSTKKFSAKSALLKLTGLKAKQKYEVQVSAYVDIPENERGWSLMPSYSGESSKVMSGTTLNKAANTIKAAGKPVNVKYSTVRKRAVTVKRAKAIKVTKAKGTLTYKLVSVKKAAFKKYFKLNKKTGKLTVKKGLKKGTYTLKIKVTAAGNATYKAGSKTATVKVKVK